MELDIAQVLSQIVAFLIMYWVLKRYAWKPLLEIMEERREKIRFEFQEIEAQKKEIAKLSAEYHQKLQDIDKLAKQKQMEEIAKGRNIAQEMRDEAHNQVKQILENAEAEAQIELNKAKSVLKNDMINLVIASTQKMIGNKLGDQDNQKVLIQEFLEQAEIK